MSAKRVRVAVLLGVLVGTSLWAASVLEQRHARYDWRYTLEVHVVILSPRAVSSETQGAARRGTLAVESWLQHEFARYRPEGIPSPVRLTLDAPLIVEELPRPPSTAWERFVLQRRLHSLADEAHPQVKADATLFLVLEETLGQTVEGLGASGGDVGWVQTSPGEVDSALAEEALGHEFLHLVGAKDHYDAAGHPQAPAGLANPEQRPLYPQTHAEVMAEEVATGPGDGRVPRSLDEVQVGPETAREIHWTHAFRD